MSFSVNYDAEWANTSVADYLADWSAYFGDILANAGTLIPILESNASVFYPGLLSGSQFAATSTQSPAAVIAGGDLYYTLFSQPAHTLWGAIDSLQFGGCLSKGAGGYTLQEVEVRFDGLGDYLQSAKAEGHDGIVHQVMFGLMAGDATVLTHVLDDILAHYGVSTANTFDQVAAALNALQYPIADATPVGVTEVVDDYAIAA